jgi:hypothetical protein
MPQRLCDCCDQSSLHIHISNRAGHPAKVLQGAQSLLDAMAQGYGAWMTLPHHAQQSFETPRGRSQGMHRLAIRTSAARRQRCGKLAM